MRARTDLSENDIKSTPMGTQGADVWLSSRAQINVPFSIECKNTERLNLWKAWAQAVANTPEGLHPMLVVGKNRTDPLVVITLDKFLSWIT